MGEYDVIIAGASFSGLSLASQLKAKVLLIDQYDIGTFQISACGTPYDVLKEMRCEDSVLQISATFSFHVNKKRIDIPLEKPYCTFHFQRFCQILNSRNQADFLKEKVLGVDRSDGFFTVHTSKGDVSSKIVADATGCKASLAENLSPGYVKKDMRSFGIEAEVPYRCESFHFFYEPDFIKDGVSWIFPCGEFSRMGVASYTGARRLIGKLDSFLGRFHLQRRKIHGGFFCYCLKEPVVQDVFVVGCAQGQTLPLTGEGIGRSIIYGMNCGRIIQKILDGEIDLKEGLNEYSGFALGKKGSYSFMLRAQNRFLRMSERSIEILARMISNRGISKFVERRYRRI